MLIITLGRRDGNFIFALAGEASRFRYFLGIPGAEWDDRVGQAATEGVNAELAVAGFEAECRAFLCKQIEIVKLSVVVTLAQNAKPYPPGSFLAMQALGIPLNPRFGPPVTREEPLRELGRKIRFF